jgi:hypothetical protein
MSTSDEMKPSRTLLQQSALPRETTFAVLVLLDINLLLAVWGFIQVMLCMKHACCCSSGRCCKTSYNAAALVRCMCFQVCWRHSDTYTTFVHAAASPSCSAMQLEQHMVSNNIRVVTRLVLRLCSSAYASQAAHSHASLPVVNVLRLRSTATLPLLLLLQLHEAAQQQVVPLSLALQVAC